MRKEEIESDIAEAAEVNWVMNQAQDPINNKEANKVSETKESERRWIALNSTQRQEPSLISYQPNEKLYFFRSYWPQV